MVNNRDKSTVCDLQWSGDGQTICIAYTDGQVMVGRIGGGRVWNKDLKIALHKVSFAQSRLVYIINHFFLMPIYECVAGGVVSEW